jgi:hypothetical protein
MNKNVWTAWEDKSNKRQVEMWWRRPGDRLRPVDVYILSQYCEGVYWCWDESVAYRLYANSYRRYKRSMVRGLWEDEK